MNTLSLNELLIKSTFIQWLYEIADTYGIDAVKGVGGKSCLCPLAEYLNTKTGKIYVITSYLRRLNEDNRLEVECRLPSWADKFTFWVDGNYNGRSVPVKDMLEYFKVT